MLNTDLIQYFNATLSAALNSQINIEQAKVLHGGSINSTYRLYTNEHSILLKLNVNQSSDFFEKEASGLNSLRENSAFRIPEVHAVGSHQQTQYLMMEYITEGKATPSSWKDLGVRLAELHQNSYSGFGWTTNNYIGSLNQRNDLVDNWIDFFVHHRLGFQSQLAHRHGILSSQIMHQLDTLYMKLPELMSAEPPALLHGDLWSGNHLLSDSQQNVLIDPAVYFGHREVDIAMMHLFGGFPKSVFDAYHAAYPLTKGWESRIDLFNLYPLLVHVNLFGASYASRVARILDRYLK